MKFKNQNLGLREDTIYNDELNNGLKITDTYENFVEIINFYLESIKKNILITYDNYLEIIKYCIR